MRYLRYSVLLVIGFVALISVQHVSIAGDPPAPYIYYYANTINAIVVERADGTDSRVIAPGAMPDNSIIIDSLDWSPSGKWMAWLSSGYNGPAAPNYRAWITRSDGTERLTLLDDAGSFIDLKWSPTADLLFVAYRKAETTYLEISIIDPNLNKIVAHTEYLYDRIDEWILGLSSGWTLNGDGVYYALYFGNTTFLSELKINNQVLNHVFIPDPYRPSFLVDLFNGRLLNYEQNYNQKPGIQLVMRDLGSGRGVFIDGLSSSGQDNQPNFSALWDPTMRYALIFVWTCPPTVDYCRYAYPPQTQLYRLDWEAGTLQFLAARIGITANEDLPTMGHYGSDLWSPDGHYAVLKDVRGRLIIIDMTTGQLLPSIGLPLSITGWQWIEQSKALILFSSNGRRLYRYDLKQKTITPLNVSINPYSWFSLSPDGRFAGLVSRYAYASKNAPDMYDLKTQGKRRWAHHSLGSSAGGITDYVWHPDSRWFMTGEWSAFSSGGPGPSSVTVFNTAGTVRRELSVCGRVGYCTGFVPDRAVPYLGEGSPASVIPEPIDTLTHENWVASAAWSPDGAKLATYSPNAIYDAGGKLTVWDMNGTPRQLAAYASDLASAVVQWSVSGQTIILTSADAEEIWDMGSGQRISTRSIPYVRRGNSVTRILPSPDHHYIAYARDFQRDITIIEADTGETAGVVSVEQPREIVWSQDSSTLFITNLHGAILVWRRDNTQIINEQYGDTSVATDTRQKLVFTASYFHRIYVWDALNGEQLPDLNFYARFVALSPDGTRLAAVGSSLVTIWDVTDLKHKESD